MKSKIFYIILLIMFILIISFAALPTYAVITNSTNTSGSAIISVLDKQDHTPISNATICIVETMEYYQTNKLGSIKFSLPTKNSNSPTFKYPKKNWQEYTLLIYKNGFYTHIYYGLKIEQNTTRTGIVINLEELSMESDHSFTQEYEFPNETWGEQLIKDYKK